MRTAKKKSLSAEQLFAADEPKYSSEREIAKRRQRFLEIKYFRRNLSLPCGVIIACDRAASNLYLVSRVTGPRAASSVHVSGAVSHLLFHLFLFLSGRPRRPRSHYFGLRQLSGVKAPRSGSMLQSCGIFSFSFQGSSGRLRLSERPRLFEACGPVWW